MATDKCPLSVAIPKIAQWPQVARQLYSDVIAPSAIVKQPPAPNSSSFQLAMTFKQLIK